MHVKKEKRGGPHEGFWLVKWMSGLRYSSPTFVSDLPKTDVWTSSWTDKGLH